MNINNDHIVFLSIGSNINRRLKNLSRCLNFIEINTKITINNISSIYDTEPLYYKKQNNFLNLVIQLSTSYKLIELLNICKTIESKMGRKLSKKINQERIIDIDILTFDDMVYSDEKITIPHPRIKERKFVLIPWVEISPKFKLPDSNENIADILNDVKDNSKICKLLN